MNMNDKKQKVLIIGGGWYGCHIASVLQELNIPYELFDDNLFSGSSSKNQNRLHLGFHYCRNKSTRDLCVNGYSKFIGKYGDFVNYFDNNYYLIAKKSLIDYGTIKSIFTAEHIPYNEVKNNRHFSNVDAVITTNEGHINHTKAKEYFEKNLTGVIKKKFDYDEFYHKKIRQYSLVLDCSNNSLGLQTDDKIYEITISLIYKSTDKINLASIFEGALVPAATEKRTLSPIFESPDDNLSTIGITVIDGNFCSLYPYDIEKQEYTLTHVSHTPLMKFTSFDEFNKYKNMVDKTPELFVDSDILKTKIELMENAIIEFYPEFKKHFEYSRYFLSTKIKLNSASDSRELSYEIATVNNTIIHSFCCCKITGIFEMEKIIRNLL